VTVREIKCEECGRPFATWEGVGKHHMEKHSDVKRPQELTLLKKRLNNQKYVQEHRDEINARRRDLAKIWRDARNALRPTPEKRGVVDRLQAVRLLELDRERDRLQKERFR